MTDNPPYSTWLRDATAVALGLTVPAMVSGRAVLQGLAAAALVAALIIAWQDRGIFRRAEAALRTRFGMVVLAAFAAMAVSIPGSLDPLRSFDAWARTGVYLGGCVLFQSFLSNDAAARRLCVKMLVAGCAVGLLAVAVAMLGWTSPLQILKNEPAITSRRWGFAAPKAYAAAIACALPVLAWLAWRLTGRWRLTAAAAMVLSAVVVVETGNKSALAGWLAMILAVTLAIALRSGRRWLVIWPAFAILVSGTILAGVTMMPDVAPSRAVWPWIPAELVDTHRQQIWRFTLDRIAETPLTGRGINVIDRVAGAHDIIPGYHAERLPSHPHNWILEILAETGVLGFIPVFFAIAWFAWRQVARFMSSGDGCHLAQLGLVATFWTSSLFNFSIWSSWWLITFFLLSAIVAGSSGPAQAGPPNLRR